MKAAIPLAKTVLALLGITAVASTIDAGIQKNTNDSGTTTLIISNKEMNGIMKIVQGFEDSNTLLKGVIKAIKNETKKTKRRILKDVVGYFRSYFVRKFIIKERDCKSWFWRQKGKEIARAGSGNRKGKGIVRAGYAKDTASSFNKFRNTKVL